MQKAYQELSEETKFHLQKQGIKPWVPKPLPDFFNPHSSLYWLCGSSIFVFSWFARKQATRIGGPRLLWSVCMFSVPFYGLVARAKLDFPEDGLGRRKTLQDRLEYAPITRNAWEKAVQQNNLYQQEILEEIEQLQQKLNLKINQ